MLILRTSTTSPFVRKIRIAANILGLMDKVRLEPCDTLDPKDSVRGQNPLGKIPTLVLEDGTALYDSPVILEYLDHVAGGGKILPASWKERLDALRLQALADGLMDAGILRVYENRFRPADRHEPKWLEHQTAKMERALDELENSVTPINGTPDVGQISLASALGWLDFRFEGAWRKSHPKLVKWLSDFSTKVPCFSETKPH